MTTRTNAHDLADNQREIIDYVLNSPTPITRLDLARTFSNTKIRLHGIDAPETRQECTQQDGKTYLCGKASTEALRILIGDKPNRELYQCAKLLIDQYGGGKQTFW